MFSLEADVVTSKYLFLPIHVTIALALYLLFLLPGTAVVNHCTFFPGSFFCCCLVAKLCLTLCDPMDCSLPGSSVRGVSQARILDWVAISFSGGVFWPRGQTHMSSIAGWFFTTEIPGMHGSFLLHDSAQVSSPGILSLQVDVIAPSVCWCCTLSKPPT